MWAMLRDCSAGMPAPRAAAARNRGPRARSSHAPLSASPEVYLSWSRAAYPCSHKPGPQLLGQWLRTGCLSFRDKHPSLPANPGLLPYSRLDIFTVYLQAAV